MEKLRHFGKKLKDSFPASTGINIEATPLYAAIETLSGMANQTSLNARLFAAGTFYLGMRFLWNTGRDISRRVFKIDPNSEKSIRIHDMIYSAGYNAVLCPLMYNLMGNDGWKEIATATIGSTVMGLANGPFQGYAADAGMDLLGTRECTRPSYPKKIQKLSSRKKKLVLVGAAAASIALTGLIYKITPDEGLWKNNHNSIPGIEQKLDS